MPTSPALLAAREGLPQGEAPHATAATSAHLLLMLPQVLPQEHNLFRQQAVSDFRSFLTLRAQEFRPRGVLVVTYVGSHQEVTEEPGSSW